MTQGHSFLSELCFLWEQNAATALTDCTVWTGHLQTKRLSPLFPAIPFCLIPCRILQEPYHAERSGCDRSLQDSRRDTGRNLPEVCEEWLLCEPFYVLRLSRHSESDGEEGDSAACGCQHCQNTELALPSETGPEVGGGGCNWRIRLGHGRVCGVCQWLPLPHTSSPTRTSLYVCA